MKDYTTEQAVYWTEKINDIAQIRFNGNEYTANRIMGIAQGILIGPCASGMRAKEVARYAGETANKIRNGETDEN